MSNNLPYVKKINYLRNQEETINKNIQRKNFSHSSSHLLLPLPYRPATNSNLPMPCMADIGHKPMQPYSLWPMAYTLPA